MDSRMRQVRVHGANQFSLDAVHTPEPGPTDILVEVAACGICGSDPFYISHGSFAAEGQPMPLGHEFAGTISAVGDEVAHFRVGQKVVVDPYLQMIGNGGLEGAFAPSVLVRDVINHADMVHLLPDNLTMEHGALVEPLAVSMHAVNRSRIRDGEKAVIIGAGPIGLGAVVVLRYLGIEEVVVADMSVKRLAIAAQLGATPCDVTQCELRDFLIEHHGESELKVRGETFPDTQVFIEATGVAQALEDCVSMATMGARIVVVGVHKSTIPLDPLLLLSEELELIGSKGYPTEFQQVLEMLCSGNVEVMPMISHRFPLRQFSEALEIAEDVERSAKVMIVME